MVVGSGVPYCRHASVASARTEAGRLASHNPGVAFTVLEAIATVCKTDLQCSELVDRSDDPVQSSGKEVPF